MGGGGWRVVDSEQDVREGTVGGCYLVVYVVVVFAFFHLCFCPLFFHVLCPFVLSD